LPCYTIEHDYFRTLQVAFCGFLLNAEHFLLSIMCNVYAVKSCMPIRAHAPFVLIYAKLFTLLMQYITVV